MRTVDTFTCGLSGVRPTTGEARGQNNLSTTGKEERMTKENTRIGCIDGSFLEVRWHSGEVALVSGNTKVRLSTEAAASLGGILGGQSSPTREHSPPRPFRRGKRISRAITPRILNYITSNRPQVGWIDIAILLDREGIRTAQGKTWTGNNLKCAFERYAATCSEYADLL